MEYVFAPSAGIGRVLEPGSDWHSLNHEPKSAAWAARFTVDPDKWEVTDVLDEEDARKILALERDRADALQLLLIALDPEFSDRVFELSCNAAAPLLQRAEVLSEVSKLILALPLIPKNALTEFDEGSGVYFLDRTLPQLAAARPGPLTDLFRQLDEAQPFVVALRKWWDAIPDELFHPGGRDACYSAIVAAGVHGQLLSAYMAGQDLRDQVDALTQREDLSLGEKWPQYADILRQWVLAIGRQPGDIVTLALPDGVLFSKVRIQPSPLPSDSQEPGPSAAQMAQLLH